MPLSQADFNNLLDRLGPFEDAPHLAVALSGGADSTALLRYSLGWAAGHDGRVTALVVDHGLRPDSAREARLTQERARQAGAECHILKWRGVKPETAIQEAAREARYRLLGKWCASHGVLHLLLGHHLDDQAETVLLRRERQSGRAGLAGMSMIRETDWGRLLRPCLAVPGGDLRAVLRQEKIGWVEDPSNQDRKYARVRLRQRLKSSGDGGQKAQKLLEGSRRDAAYRADAEFQTARDLAAMGGISPLGFATLDLAAFRALPVARAQNLMAQLTASVGGSLYRPRGKRVDAAVGALRAEQKLRGRTLGGCVLFHRRGRLFVAREAVRCARANILAGETLHWDNRFRVSLPRAAGASSQKFQIRSFSDVPSALRGEIRRKSGHLAQIPAPAIDGIPALFAGNTPVAVPHLGYGGRNRYDNLPLEGVRFMPLREVTGAPFAVV